jgi:hypothetical protein
MRNRAENGPRVDPLAFQRPPAKHHVGQNRHAETMRDQSTLIGDLLSFYADIAREGRMSITVNVEVFAQRMGMAADVVQVTEATLTFVATDSARTPRPLPPVDTVFTSALNYS